MLRRLLILGAETPALQRVVPLLLRTDFEVHRVSRVSEAAGLLMKIGFDLLVVRYPVPGLSLDGLIQTVRTRSSPSRAAGLLLLAEPSFVREVGGFLGRGVNRVVSLDAPSDRLLHAVADLVGVSPRVAVRAVVQLELWVAHGPSRLLTVTENLSETGALVRGGQDFPLGARLSFELTLPGSRQPIDGELVVMRKSNGMGGGVDGIGVRFTSFKGDGQGRLAAFLAGSGASR